MNRLITDEGKTVDLSCPLPEHPSPQFRREGYACLNGRWDFYIDDKKTSSIPKFKQQIIVPFAVETYLSGIETSVKPTDVMHYRRFFDLPDGFDPDHVVLHFEAVDQVCDVYLNGELLGHHEGGYHPFSFPCPKLKEKGNELRVNVTDDTGSPYFPRGKQSTKPGGIWYHPTSGIYGSVWLEEVPEKHIEDVTYETHYQTGICKVFVKLTHPKTTCKIRVFFKEELVFEDKIGSDGVVEMNLSKHLHLWGFNEPNLYNVDLIYGDDLVHSYFGIREIGVIEHHGRLFPTINGQRIFLTGPLDQGYYPESGLTPPTVKAMRLDLTAIKSCGFTMVRKHIKIEPRRYYYLCDRLGMLVMQDFVNIGAPYSPLLIVAAPFLHIKMDDSKPKTKKRLGIIDEKVEQAFISHVKETTELLKNHPCVVSWTLFNEGWGQFDTRKIEPMLDHSRLIDANSGWYDQGAGNFDSHHVYFRKVRLKQSKDRILSLSEFGGYSLKIEGHTYSNRSFGYKKMKSKEHLQQSLIKLYENEIIPLKKQGIAVAVYTQWTDVEEEINGIMTYDRKVMKVDPAVLRSLNAKLREM